MTYKSNRPISAYSMYDYEDLTADFKRGKDKKKRKRRGAMIAGGIGAGALGVGAGAAGLYGLGTKSTVTNTRTATGDVRKTTLSPIAQRMRRETDALKETVKELGQKGKRKQAFKDLGTNIKGIARETGRGISVGAGKLKYAVTSRAGKIASSAKDGYRMGSVTTVGDKPRYSKAGKALQKTGKVLSGIGSATKSIYRSGNSGKAALALGALGAAGAVGGAGYGAYKMMKNRKNRND